MSKDPRVYLAHIMECIQKIERFTQGGRERFLQDELTQDAVLRNFEVIGEAAKRMDDVYRATHPEIPWCAIAGLRDVLIHQYEGVDLNKVWAIVEKDFPGLKQSIAGLLPPLEQLERELSRARSSPRRRHRSWRFSSAESSRNAAFWTCCATLSSSRTGTAGSSRRWPATTSSTPSKLPCRPP